MSWLTWLFLTFALAVVWFLARPRRGPSRTAPRPAPAQDAPAQDAPQPPEPPHVAESAAPSSGWAPAVRATLPADTLHRLHNLVANFPELPVGTQRIMLALQEANATPQQIARLAGSDPALAARILRVVNSSFYNLPHKVSDLSLAIVLLGYTQVRSLVLQGGVGRVLVAQDRRSRVELDEFWYHSFCTATCAFHFARKLGTVSPGQASTLGLLHDLGKPVWWWANPTAQELGLPGVSLSTRMSLLEEEQNSFGANHQALGALLVVKWGLPGEVARGIEYHHHPTVVPKQALPDDVRDLANVLWLADQAAHRFAILAGDEVERRKPEPPEGESAAPDTALATFHLLDDELHRELMRARALLDPHPVHS